MKNKSANRTIGTWSLINRIGQGGNGEVWLCSDGVNERAIKILKKVRSKSLQRFTDETLVLENNNDLSGIVPILEKDLSTQNNVPYFIMPVANDLSLIHISEPTRPY